MSEGALDHQRAVRSFYVHALVFAIVNMILLIVNLKKSPRSLWIKWVLIDWGVGLATHAWIVFRSGFGDDGQEFSVEG